ncbi:peptidylprolyl isomerase [Gloeocapsa sp. PCC 73106]|uniref:peptidylprolyl isomerase n=1 Tax=Gloeocapsa sp. PCC 73106 TaxID=102232 RepID=UPI0002ACDA28|nr:peptidylprolyl isomerase [Gloeocapsa sp. PCC 73106]ELR97181.1 parvulin-like peptidyl-prolyl isomerase [Gloeocapsa sp. PCC 73106]
MEHILTINSRQIDQNELLPLLGQYLMLPQLAKEVIIADATKVVECTEEEKQVARERFLEENQLKNDTELQQWLNRTGVGPEQLQELTLRKLKVEKFKEQTWGDQLEIYFMKRKRDLDQVVYSLIRTKKPGLAQEIYFRILEGESDFKELASKYSEGVEAQTQGIIGPVELSSPHPQIAQALVNSQPGKLFEPMRIGEWIVIIRLENIIPARLDKSTARRLLDELFQQWLKEQMTNNVSFFSNEQVNKTEIEH